MTQQPTTPRDLVRRVIRPIAIAWLFLPLAFIIPWLNSTRSPYFDLTGGIGQVASVLAEVGGLVGTIVIFAFLILMVVNRSYLSLKQRGVEFLVLALLGGGLLGAGVLVNEFIIKPAVKEPRPHVKLLARTPTDTPPDSSILATTAEDFYTKDDTVREANLRAFSKKDSLAVLGDQYCFEAYGDEELFLSTTVCDQWIHTIGFSFPSGHSFTAMFIAAFFLGMAFYVMLGGWRLAFIRYLVVPYGVLVCYSRTALRVHSPLDISVGGLLGILLALLALVLVVKALTRFGGK